MKDPLPESSAAIPDIVVPHNSDIEAGILGAVLRDNTKYSDLSRITPEMFYISGHQKLWEIIQKQLDQGNPVTPITLKHQVASLPELSGFGGAEYLTRLAFEEFSIISPKRYAEILLDLFHKRTIIDICQDGATEAMDHRHDDDANTIRHRIEEHLYKLNSHRSASRTHSLAQASSSAIDEIGKILEGKSDGGVPTGFKTLHNVMGGLRRSDLLILAARPAMGKTSLALNIALNAAKSFHKQQPTNPQDHPKSVVFFSLEMSAEQLSMRILSDCARIKFEKLRLGSLKQAEFNRYLKTQKEIAPYPLYIEEDPNINVAEMRAILRRISRENPVGLVFLDYLQLLTSPDRRRNENRVQELSEITRGLKLLAREFDIPIVALSQLSRQVENRDNKTPILADLRDSGSIEQDADLVLFLYRPEYYLKGRTPEQKENESAESFERRKENHERNLDKFRGVAKIIIAKNRHGAPCTEELHFHEELISFSDPDFRYQDNHGTPINAD